MCVCAGAASLSQLEEFVLQSFKSLDIKMRSDMLEASRAQEAGPSTRPTAPIPIPNIDLGPAPTDPSTDTAKGPQGPKKKRKAKYVERWA